MKCRADHEGQERVLTCTERDVSVLPLRKSKYYWRQVDDFYLWWLSEKDPQRSTSNGGFKLWLQIDHPICIKLWHVWWFFCNENEIPFLWKINPYVFFDVLCLRKWEECHSWDEHDQKVKPLIPCNLFCYQNTSLNSSDWTATLKIIIFLSLQSIIIIAVL